MKIIFDTDKNVVKVGNKTFGVNMPIEKQDAILLHFNNFVKDNTKLDDFSGYEEDSMWMSYRYCIGRHTIASQMRAGDIGAHCYGRMSDERSIFTAFDINREIEDRMRFGAGPKWHFPITSLDRIYTTAIDIFCQFIEEYKIKSKKDYLRYYSINVILTDDERGYKIETVTWEEKIESLIPVFKELYEIETVEEIVNTIKRLQKEGSDDIDSRIQWVIRSYPNSEYFYFFDIENLFVWNDLCHLFDVEHHHKSILTDGSECEWYWTYVKDIEQREDGHYYFKEVGYKKIRVPIDAKIGRITTHIPDDAINKDLY